MGYLILTSSQKMCLYLARMDGEKAVFFAKITPEGFLPGDCCFIVSVLARSAAAHVFRAFPELREEGFGVHFVEVDKCD